MPYEKVLDQVEAKAIYVRLKEKWGIEGRYWYPITP